MENSEFLNNEELEKVVGGTEREILEYEGIVVDKKPNGAYKVVIEGHEIEAHLSGKCRINNMRILVGDTVIVEVSPYEVNRGRIIDRLH